MRAITLRNIPPEVQKAIQRKAREKKISANRAVIELLRERVGILENKKKVYHDLDDLAGSWSAKEAKSFEKALGELRRIDEDLWR
jgi:DNA polymerase III delta subunit